MQVVLRGGAATVAVRPARAGDAAAIAAIYNAGIRGRMATFETRERTADDVAAWFTRDGHPTLVAERDGHVVGWVAASPYRARECYAGIAEFSVYVDHAVQGQRVGDALMSAFIPALELCRRHGFREVGVYERHARLDDAWRDVVIVERLLGEAARS
jgi:phosphinothricin acetyltransferase